METLFKDIRYGFRGLLKRKGFAAIAVLTLALGIGANTAIFTLVNAVMLKSLPVEKPEELVLFSDATGEGTLSKTLHDQANGNVSRTRLMNTSAITINRFRRLLRFAAARAG